MVNLRKTALSIDSLTLDNVDTEIAEENDEENQKIVAGHTSFGPLPISQKELPENLVVLFVDDDMVLRKLFSRALRKIRPKWQFHEAANGETALRLIDDQNFDIIFMDQYLASIDKQLLGTEAVRALRAKGVESIICGLSANDMEEPFLQAGANSFMMKPFPCGKESLTRELSRVLYGSTIVSRTRAV